MKCRFCDAWMEEEQNVCPQCGRDQTEMAEEESAAEAAEETCTCEETAAELTEACEEMPAEPACEEPVPEKKRKGGLWLLLALAAVAVIAVVVLVVYLTKSDGVELPSDTTDFAYVDQDGNFVQHDFARSSDEVTEEMANTVIANCGDVELTNLGLSYYYWQSFSSYQQFLAYMMDMSLPHAEQMADETHTWQDKILTISLESFRQNAALQIAAEAENYELSEGYVAYMDYIREDLANLAAQNGVADGDAYLQAMYGPYATVDSFLAYGETVFLAQDYLQNLYNGIEYTEADVEAYFDEKAAEYEADGLVKDDTKLINVRHILITPTADENAELDETGSPVLTDQNWADAKVQAEEILAQWESGEATEESFAALALEHSTDPGSAANGGLYEDVYPGQMVEAFNDWCFDASRQVGDVGIVETPYGYHIMYFSGAAEQYYWYTVAESDYLSDLQTKILEDLVAETAITVDYDKLILMEPEQADSAETAQE